ncbi:MAG: hypothetical protein QM811_23200 [Pirellulales bacterium]
MAKKAAEKKLTQKEAVRQALAANPKSKPLQLAPIIKEKFGMELTPQRISFYKGQLKGKSKGKGTGKAAKSTSGALTFDEVISAKKAIDSMGGPSRVEKILAAMKQLS